MLNNRVLLQLSEKVASAGWTVDDEGIVHFNNSRKTEAQSQPMQTRLQLETLVRLHVACSGVACMVDCHQIESVSKLRAHSLSSHN